MVRIHTQAFAYSHSKHSSNDCTLHLAYTTVSDFEPTFSY